MGLLLCLLGPLGLRHRIVLGPSSLRLKELEASWFNGWRKMVVIPIDIRCFAIGIQLEFEDRLIGDHQGIACIGIDSPDFCGQANFFGCAVLERHQHDHGHDQSSDIFELQSVEPIGVGEKFFFMRGHLLECFFVGGPLLLGDGSGIVLVVEVFEFRILVGPLGNVFVPFFGKRRQLSLTFGFLIGGDFIRGSSIHHENINFIQCDIDMVGRVEPTSPEPI